VGEGDAALVFGASTDAVLELAADVFGAGLAEALEESVDEDLGFALLVAPNVLGAPVNECLKSLGPAAVCHLVKVSGGARGVAWRWRRRRPLGLRPGLGLCADCNLCEPSPGRCATTLSPGERVRRRFSPAPLASGRGEEED